MSPITHLQSLLQYISSSLALSRCIHKNRVRKQEQKRRRTSTVFLFFLRFLFEYFCVYLRIFVFISSYPELGIRLHLRTRTLVTSHVLIFGVVFFLLADIFDNTDKKNYTDVQRDHRDHVLCKQAFYSICFVIKNINLYYEI